jgi:MOSC domain-containing protein YiiM
MSVNRRWGEFKLGSVFALSKCSSHEFSKTPADSLRLIEGEGVEGDAHRGVTVKHRSRVRADPTQPNLRQVHLIHHELIQELRAGGFEVAAANMGENITTAGIDLLALPTRTILHIGSDARVEVTGLRNPCAQLDQLQNGLKEAVSGRDESGKPRGRIGVMGIVLKSGVVATGDHIEVVLPPEPHKRLERV